MTHRSFSIVAKDDKFGLAITTTYKKSSKGNKQIIYGYFSAKAANNDIEKLCQNETILPISRIFRFQRRARDFIRLYISPSLRNCATAPSYSDLERMRKKQATHRNIMEVDRCFVQSS